MTAVTWRQTFEGNDGIELQLPTPADSIAAAELHLDVTLPAELRTLYEATNGIYDRLGQWFVMWRLEDLASHNLEAWRGWETDARRRFLGFGDDGTGGPFCVDLTGDRTVFTWSPIDQAAQPLASDLLEFWTNWLAGKVRT